MARAKKAKAPAQPALFEEAPTVDLSAIEDMAVALTAAIDALPLAAKVEALNRVRTRLHEVSPFKFEPVDCVLWFLAEEVEENSWNPNAFQAPEYVALEHSVTKFGYTMSIVGARAEHPAPGSRIKVRITDGKHRNVVGRVNPAIRARLHGYLPISLLNAGLTEADQMSATILHNEARGKHSVVKEVAIVAALDEAGWTSEQVGLGTVKSREELVRIRQLGGAAQNLASPSYGKAWTF